MSRNHVNRLVLVLVALALAAAGCGSSSDEPKPSASKTSAEQPASEQPAEHPASEHPYIKNRLPKPTLPGAHPTAKVDRLVVKDVVEGKGTQLGKGDAAYLTYAAVNYRTGKAFGLKWGQIMDAVGIAKGGDTPRGWIAGLPGMRVGGRRVLIVPPALLRSDLGGPVTQRSAVYFVVDLLGVTHGKRSQALPSLG